MLLRIRRRDLPAVAGGVEEFPKLTIAWTNQLMFGENPTLQVAPHPTAFGGQRMVLWERVYRSSNSPIPAELTEAVAAFNADPRAGWLQVILESAERAEQRADARARKWEAKAIRAGRIANIAHGLLS